ncbi:polysaccharide biosynthesis protein [bacterium]|nr:polysaccharide biosynthesis protein [bacterium]
MSFKTNITGNILSLPRFAKQFIAILCDLSLCFISVVVAFYLRLDQFVFLKGPALTAIWASMLIALPVFWLTGLYRTIFRYSGLSIMFSVSIAIMVYTLLYFCIFTLYRIEGIPRSIGLLQPMILFFGIISSRLCVKFVLGQSRVKKHILLKNTLVYGAGSAGRQLVSSLENSFEYKVIGFLDDDDRLKGQVLQGHKIYHWAELNSLTETEDIDLVLLAFPSVSRFKRNQILKKLKQYKLVVQTLPSMSDIIEGKVTVSDIKEIDVNDILNRDIVPAKEELLSKNIYSKVVVVTGAGGSIGSELCRQIIKLKPKSLVLCELNEFALYKIYEELKLINKKLKIIPLICNLQDESKINEILKVFCVDTVYHAAAYKHVPLVESNICEGVKNNVIGTFSIAKACIEQQVSNFVLISSDKAVRPTNVMGASKRLSELCVQALYHQYQNSNIKMSIVRFGNVLESSGSVIPKFKQQIKQGGPITLTHPDVTRYFMTITEAAQLVIQAGAMSEQCNVFVLDMGKSIKIKDLIYRIVELSGLTVKDDEYSDGDIEIKVTGLRPGEKLYEELLLGDNPQTTTHEKIKKTQDPFISLSELEKHLTVLKSHLTNNKAADVKLILENILSSYQSEYKIVDYLYNEQAGLLDNQVNLKEPLNKVISLKK